MNNKAKTHIWLFSFALLAFLGPFGTVIAIESAKKEVATVPNKPSIADLPLEEAPRIPPEPVAEPTPTPAAISPETTVIVKEQPVISQPKPTTPAPQKAVKKPKSSSKTKTS